MTTAKSLSPLERLHLRDQLQDLWRKQVELLAGAGDGEFAQRQAAVRALLLEVEAAMQRMDCRRYGICEQCAEPIPTVDLFKVPHRRRCPGCEVPTEGRRSPSD